MVSLSKNSQSLVIMWKIERTIALVVLVAQVIACQTFDGYSRSRDVFSNRFQRAVSTNFNVNFQSFAERMSVTARIVTGLSLKIGLLEGTTPVDAVIVELLSIGRLPDLEQVESQHVVQLLERMNKLLDTQRKEITDVAKEIVDLQSLGPRLEGIVKKMSEAGSFDRIKSASFERRKEITQFEIFDPSQAANFRLWSKDVERHRQNITKSASDVVAVIDSFKEDKLADETLTAIDNFVDVALAYTKHKYSGRIEKFDEKSLVSVADDIEKFENVTSARDDEKSLRLMTEILNSTRSRLPINRTHTSGFVNGFHDVDLLTDDTKDAWLLAHVVNAATVKLDTVLSLTRIKTAMERLDEEWHAMGSAEHLDDVTNIVGFYKQLRVLRPASSLVVTVLKDLKKCKNVKTDATLLEALGSLRKVVDLLKAVKAITDFVSGRVKKVALEVKSGHFQPVLQLASMLEKTRRDVIAVQGTTTLESRLNELIKFKEDLTTFSDYVKFFACVQKSSSPDSRKVTEWANLSKQMRTVKTRGNLAAARNASDAISRFRAAFNETRTQFATIRHAASTELGRLARLKDLQSLAKPFGDAVAAVVTIQKALEYRQEIEMIASSGDAVNRSIGLVGDERRKREIRKLWGHFEKDSEALKRMIVELEKRSRTVGKPSGERLLDYAPFFEPLIGMSSVSIEWDQKIAAVEMLTWRGNGSRNDSMAKLKEALEDVSYLDLHFSRFDPPLSQASEVLSRVSKVLSADELEQPERDVPIGADVEEVDDQTWLVWLMMLVAVPIGSSYLITTLVKDYRRNKKRAAKKGQSNGTRREPRKTTTKNDRKQTAKAKSKSKPKPKRK